MRPIRRPGWSGLGVLPTTITRTFSAVRARATGDRLHSHSHLLAGVKNKMQKAILEKMVSILQALMKGILFFEK